MIIKVNKYKDILCNDKYNIFNTEDIKLTEDLCYCDVSDIDSDEQKEELEKFGAVIRNNAYYILDKYSLEIVKSYEHNALFDIKRNNIRLPIYSNLEIDIELTKIGKEYEQKAISLGKTILDIIN